MLKSLFFRRILSLLLLALIMWTVMTAVFYSIISRPIFTRIKVNELLPKAQSIAVLAAPSYFEEDPYFESLLNSAYEFFDAWIYVVDGVSGEFQSSALPETAATADPEIRAEINRQLEPILSGQASSLWFTRVLRNSHRDYLFVGVPVTHHFGLQNSVVGAVYFVKPLAELNAGFRSMNIALVTAALLVLALMLGPAYWATAHLIRPLRQTRDIALALAAGNYSLRADVQQKSEIGELAQSMNLLSEQLSITIAELTRERNRLRQIIDGIAEGIIAVDATVQVTQVNRCVWRLLGLAPAANVAGAKLDPTSLTARQPADLLAIDPLQAVFSEVLTHNQAIELSLTIQHRVIHCQVVPLADGSDVVGAVGLFRDITEAERLEQTRRDYVANISHELRTPLTAMRALVEPLRDGMVAQEADRQRYYHILLRETVRLSRLIDDMLELSRLQAGTLSMVSEPMHLSNLIADLVQEYGPRAEDLGLTIQSPLNLDACPPVLGNHDRIEQVLVILLDNAMKYTEDGGSIAIDLAWSASQVQVSVRDTGVGIDPEDIDHVFERFYKADKAHEQPGTGLGLSIAREILSKMGQRISVQSTPGQGSVFAFTLDRATLRGPEA